MYSKMEVFTIAFVVCMVALAEHLRVKDIIFPEIAALAFGAWVMEDRPWEGPIWTIWFSPTLGAVTGVYIVRLMGHSPAAMVALAFAFVIVELKLFRSAMSPSFSAAILPIIIHTKSFTYPLSVGVMTAVVALLAAYNEKKGTTRRVCSIDEVLDSPQTCRPGHATALAELLHYGKLVVLALLVAILATKSSWLYLIAPPLIVVFVELTHPGSTLREKSMKRLLLLLTASALEGMVWVAVVVQGLSGPIWLAAGLSVATALTLARGLRLSSPPALALSLLPTILPPAALYLYPLHVLLGSLVFIVLSLTCFKSNAA